MISIVRYNEQREIFDEGFMSNEGRFAHMRDLSQKLLLKVG